MFTQCEADSGYFSAKCDKVNGLIAVSDQILLFVANTKKWKCQVFFSIFISIFLNQFCNPDHNHKTRG